MKKTPIEAFFLVLPKPLILVIFILVTILLLIFLLLSFFFRTFAADFDFKPYENAFYLWSSGGRNVLHGP